LPTTRHRHPKGY